MSEEQGGEQVSGAEVREATFPQARRGYDREAVHAFLDRVADWVESRAGEAADAAPALTSEFARVGERTAGILTAAEEAAAKLRREAKEYADRVRTSADEEARKAKLNASQKVDELIAEAQTKAENIVDEAIARRRRLNQAVASLIERREEIADEAQRLADQLLEAVETLRADDRIDDGDDEPASEELDEVDSEDSPLDRERFSPPDGEATELEPPDQRETTIHESR